MSTQSGTINVRIWREVHAIYKDIADKYGFYLSNLMSAILLEAAINPSVIVSALVKHFDVDSLEAQDIAIELHNKTVTLLNMLAKAAEEEAKEEIEVKEAHA